MLETESGYSLNMSKENIKIFKFLFEAQVGKLVLPIKFPCKIKLTWKRSAEVTEIEPLDLNNGSLDFNRKLSLNVNMYYDTEKLTFLEKKSLFTFIIVTEKGEKCAGVVTIDFATKLNERVQQYKKTYTLQKCPMKESSVELTIFSHPISEQELDSMSQITTAPEILQQSLIQPTVSSESFFTDQEDKQSSSSPTKESSFLLTGQFASSNPISDNLLKMNDMSTKINDYVVGFSQELKGQMKRLREKTRSLEEKLQRAATSKAEADQSLEALKLQNRTLKQQIESKAQQYQHQIERVNASLIDANSKVEKSESSRRSLQAAQILGEEQKIQYLHSQISSKQESITSLTQTKNDLEDKLSQQRRQTNQLKTKLSSVQSDLQTLKSKYSTLSSLKAELEAQKRNNEEEVQAMKLRLETVYQDLVDSLKNII